MSKDNFPVNEAKAFVEVSIETPLIGFLGGEQGKEINNSIKKDYKNFPALQIANYGDGLIKGSNPFFVVAVQERLPNNMRVASQSDLEKALKWKSLDLKGIYVDSSLALKTEENPNSYLAKNLIAQIKKRDSKSKMPVMIPLCELSLVEDSSSVYGLRFELKEDANILFAPILNKESGNFSLEDVNLKIGLPKKLGEGNRYFYTRKDGLSRVYLDGDSSVSSINDILQDSNSNGRVGVVNAVGVAPEILEQRVQELKNINNLEIKKINKRYQEAVKILKSE
ncbi:MAG: hypothetical protein ABIE46_03240 [Patescibacteria group bacterium]